MQVAKPAFAVRLLMSLAIAMSFAVAAVPPAPAFAQASLAEHKATVDAAKASGQVGEQADGYLGFVNGSAPNETVAAAVAAINAGRAEAFRDAAAKAGVSVEATAGAAAARLLSRVPTGQYYRAEDGRWLRK